MSNTNGLVTTPSGKASTYCTYTGVGGSRDTLTVTLKSVYANQPNKYRLKAYCGSFFTTYASYGYTFDTNYIQIGEDSSCYVIIEQSDIA